MIAQSLGGFTCQHAPAVIHLRNPLTLSNWILPVLDVIMVSAAVVASTPSADCAARATRLRRLVHHCFYEVFDQLGPQLRWWAWNTENSINHPMLASMPMTSVFIFATLGPIVVTVLVLLLVGSRPGRRSPTGWSLVWRTALAGALVPVGLAILSVPTSLFGGHNPNTTAQAAIFSAELAVIAVIALPVLVGQWDRESTSPHRFVCTVGSLYLSFWGRYG